MFYLLLLMIKLVTILVAAAEEDDRASIRPHILVIMADDLGYNDVGYHGSEIFTPNIDKLAIDGIRLESYYTSPSCGPSRAMFMSGRYNIHTATQHGNFFPCKPYGLPLEYPTVAEELKDLGYQTHMIGKWHLGHHTTDYLPTRRGFDSFRGFLTGSGDHFTHMKKYGSRRALDFYEGETPLNATYGYYSTHVFTRRATNIIRNYNTSSDEPLFMFLSYQAPHTPLQVPSSYTERYSFISDESRRIFAGMVTALDEGVGLVVDSLKQTGIYDNTVVLFTTDNGGQQARGSSNYPLKGNKDTLYEAGVRAVGFVSSPLLQKTGGVVHNELLHITDWMPTFIHLAGGNVTHLNLDGINQWNTLSKGVPTGRKDILLNIDQKTKIKEGQSKSTVFDTRIQAGIRWQDWKLLTGDPGYPFWVPAPQIDYAAYRFAAKLITNKGEAVDNGTVQSLFLYNIRFDPHERFNLVKVRPDVTMELLQRLAMYGNSSLPVRDPPNDRRCNPARHGGVWAPYLNNNDGIFERKIKPRRPAVKSALPKKFITPVGTDRKIK